MEILIKVSQFILSLSLIIVLHEFGHYWPAKYFKIKVEKFYLFFDVNFSLFKKKIGETEFGLFCEIEKHYISGLVHVSDLSRDRYIFDKEANILKGKKTGKTFRIGQKIKVQLVNVIPEERKIVLIPK